MTAYVYWLLDAEDNILYIGCTSDLKNRMRRHAQTKDWWPSVASVAHTAEMPRGQALAMEHVDTHTLLPAHNTYNKAPVILAPASLPMSPEHLSSPQAAALLKCSAKTIHRLVAAGTLKPYMVTPGGPHGAFLFHRVDVEKLAKTRRAA